MDLTGGSLLLSGGSIDVTWRTTAGTPTILVEISPNNSTWTTVTTYSVTSGSFINQSVPLSVNTRYVRFTNTNGSNLDFDAVSYFAACCTLPTITTSGIISQVCLSNVPQLTSLLYTGTSGDPVSYSINWNAAAETAGLTDQGTTVHAFPIGGAAGIISDISIPGTVITAGTYSGTMTITNAGGCTATQPVSISIPAPQVAAFASFNGNTSLCNGDIGQLVMTITGVGPYTVVYNNGVSDVTVPDPVVSGTPFAASPNPTSGTTTYTLVSVTGADGCVRTAAMGFTDGSASISVRQLPTGTITGPLLPSVCQFVAEPLMTFTGSNTGTTSGPYTFTYKINNGADQTVTSPGSSSTATLSVPTTSAGLFTYELVAVAYDSNPACSTVVTGQTATVEIIASPPVGPISGGAVSVCVGGTTAPFSNSTPLGTWSIINGTGSASIDNGTGIVTGITAGQVTVVYTVGDGTCQNSASVPLTVVPTTTAADAGPDKSICHPFFTGSPSVSLDGNTPAVGQTGTWSVVTGPGAIPDLFSNVNDPNAVFTPQNGVGPYTLRWTITNPPCDPSSNDVVIDVVLAPATPPVPITNTPLPHCANLGGVVLEYGGLVPGNQEWFWQTSATGTATDPVNSAPAFNVTAAGTTTVYLRARLIAAPQCWSDASSIAVTINTVPGTPGTITGQNNICAGSGATSPLTYTVGAVPNTTHYVWTVPTGWTITSALPSTNSITVIAGNSSQDGNISVIAVNECGQSVSSPNFAVTINTANDIAFNTLGGPTTLTICVGAATSIQSNNPDNNQDYRWLVSTSATGPFIDVDPPSGDIEDYTISGTYINNPGTYYFRREVTANAACNSLSNIIELIVNPAATASAGTAISTCSLRGMILSILPQEHQQLTIQQSPGHPMVQEPSQTLIH